MTARIVVRVAAIACLVAAVLCAQRYKGPVPPKPDLPYIIHGENLVATDVAEAKEETRKDWRVYVVPGAASQAKTPLAGPMFLVQAERLAAIGRASAQLLRMQDAFRDRIE